MNDAEKYDLKPCPFCGETEYLEMNATDYAAKNHYYVSCRNGCCEQGTLYDEPEDAAYDWNERPE